MDEITEEEFEEAIEQIKVQHQKGSRGGKNHAVLKQIMDKTQKRRAQWIRDGKPMVSEIIATFPCLNTLKGVSAKVVIHVAYELCFYLFLCSSEGSLKG